MIMRALSKRLLNMFYMVGKFLACLDAEQDVGRDWHRDEAPGPIEINLMRRTWSSGTHAT